MDIWILMEYILWNYININGWIYGILIFVYLIVIVNGYTFKTTSHFHVL